MATATTEPSSGPWTVRAGQTAGGEPLNIFGDLVFLKLTGKETGGKWVVLETIAEPGYGPPLHVHHREDESFYVLEGTFLIETNGNRMEAHAGDFLFTPRGTPHTFMSMGPSVGRVLVIAEPAGLEDFFRELAALTGPPDPASVAPIFAKYGLELLGPPLAARL
jgi:quercetin 2,3-dioxygenase